MKPIAKISLIFMIATACIFPPQTASAVSASDWQAGNIADDAVFTDTTSMSVSDIQSWLNSRIACDTSGSKVSELGGGTRAQYGVAHSNPAPFTCLNNYYEVPKTSPSASEPVSNYGQSTIPSGAISAAQIIYNAAIQYNISPKVLLVKLGTESPGPLTSDEWPFKKQFLYAMGAHCPDTGPNGSANCDVNYSGFSIQISEAAKLLRGYLDNMTQPWWSLKKPYETNDILWNVSSTGCGSGPVYIESKATAALYTYTPYQPNAAALNNMYGTGDECSAYGNRNFWRVYHDWFGATNGAPLGWTLRTEEIYSDESRTAAISFDTLAPNTTYYIKLTAKNTGNRAWSNTGTGPILLATNNPTNRTSALCDTSWVNCQRPALLQENTVNPGETGTFLFSIKTPSSYGTYNESFRLVSEGVSWFNDIGMYLPLAVTSPTSRWQPIGQTIYSDAATTIGVNTDNLAQNATYYLVVKALNIGNTTWTNSGSNPVRLGTSHPTDRSSQFYDSSWVGVNRPATLSESSVVPGQTGTFKFAIHTTNTTGQFKEYFRPVVEGKAWMNDVGMYQPFTVNTPTPQWMPISQQTYTDETLATTADSSNVSGGSRVYLVVKALNTGNTTWTNSGSNPVRLGTSSPNDRTSVFYDSSWIGSNRPATLAETSVAPGQVGTFKFWLTTPYAVNGTQFKEYFRPVVEGKAWMNDVGMYQPFKTQTSNSVWQYAGQSAYSDSKTTTMVDTANLKTNQTYYLVLRAKNTSGVVWTNSGSNPVRLGTSHPTDRSSQFYDSSWVGVNRPATLSESSVVPGQTGTFKFAIHTPSSAVTSNEYFRPLIEGASWLTDVGLYWQISVK